MEWMLLPLKRYAEFSGRSRRMEYWMYTLGVVIMYVIFGVIAGVIVGGAAGFASSGGGGRLAGGMMGMFASLGLLGIILAVIWLALLIPSIAVTIRRLHDTNRSGFWILAYFGPYVLGYILAIAGAAAQSTPLIMLGGACSILGFVMALVLLVFMFLPGTAGSNRFGPDPKGGIDASVFA